MPKGRNFSVEVRSTVVTLSEEGYSQRAIAARLKVSLCAVQNILTKKEETGSVRDKPRSGRPKQTSSREDRLLVRLSLNNRRASSKQLKRELQDASGCSVSTGTVRRRLLHAGLKGCIAAKKPMLTAKHWSARFSWAKERRFWQQESMG